MVFPFEVRQAVPALGLKAGEVIEFTPGADYLYVFGDRPRSIPFDMAAFEAVAHADALRPLTAAEAARATRRPGRPRHLVLIA